MCDEIKKSQSKLYYVDKKTVVINDENIENVQLE